MNCLSASFATSSADAACECTEGGGSERTWHRAWCEVDRFLRHGDWLDSYTNYETRDYDYLHSFLLRHGDFASQLFGGYPQHMPGAYMPFQLMEKEKQKKAYPLAYLIAARAPLDVLQDVYQLFPSARFQRQGADQGLLLHIACRHGVSLDVLTFLVQKHEKSLVEFDSRGNLPLHCAAKCRQWQPHCALDIFKLLVERAPKSAIVQNNLLGVSPLMYCLKNDTLSQSVIQYMVRKLPGSFTGTIQFTASVINESCAGNLVNLMPKLRANQNSTSSHSLVMKSCNIDIDALQTVFASPSPSSVLLAHCKVFDHRDTGSGATNNYRLASGLERLCINDCSMEGDCFRWLLNHILYNMPNLKHLTLTDPSHLLRDMNITDFVVAMLRLPSGILSYLSTDGFAVDLESLVDTLSHENTTTYVTYSNNVHDPRIRYYSTLNQYGRSAAQNPRTSRHGFVQHLVAMLGDDSIDENFKVVSSYGLLRECPILWSAEGGCN
jgi:ankyrin repeat protein